MKTNLSTKTPFILPGDAAETQYHAILAATTESRLFGQEAPSALPFTVPDGFWEQQYSQILSRKASPSWQERHAHVLRPALSLSLGLLLMVGFYLQPASPNQPIVGSAWVLDAISDTPLSDTELILEDALSPPATSANRLPEPADYDEEIF